MTRFPDRRASLPERAVRPTLSNTFTRLAIPAAFAVVALVGLTSPAQALPEAAGPADDAVSTLAAAAQAFPAAFVETPTAVAPDGANGTTTADTSGGGSDAAGASGPSELLGPAGVLLVSLLVWGAGAAYATRRRMVVEQREAELVGAAN